MLLAFSRSPFPRRDRFASGLSARVRGCDPRPRKAAPHLHAPRVLLFLIIPTSQNGKPRPRAIKERVQAAPARKWGSQYSDVSLSSSEPLWDCANESGAWKTGKILMLALFSSADGWKTKIAVKDGTCPQPGVNLRGRQTCPEATPASGEQGQCQQPHRYPQQVRRAPRQGGWNSSLFPTWGQPSTKYKSSDCNRGAA